MTISIQKLNNLLGEGSSGTSGGTASEVRVEVRSNYFKGISAEQGKNGSNMGQH